MLMSVNSTLTLGCSANTFSAIVALSASENLESAVLQDIGCNETENSLVINDENKDGG